MMRSESALKKETYSMDVRRRTGAILVVCAAVWAPVAAVAQWNPPNPVVSFEKQANGLDIHQKDGVLKFEVDAPDVLHVTFAPLDASQPTRQSDHVVIKTDWPAASFDVAESDKTITLTTAKLKVAIERQSGSIHYQGADGKQLTTDTYRMLHPAEVNGEQTFHAEVAFGIYGSHEGFYGLGQHQAGVWNYRGETVDLSQENTEIARSESVV